MKYELSTIDYYERNAERFWAGTRDHDVTQNYDAFLKSMTGDGPYKILDFGCGPGPTISVMFEEMGIECSNYDPLFFPEKSLLEAEYDFVYKNENYYHSDQTSINTLIREKFKDVLKINVLDQRWNVRLPIWNKTKDPHILHAHCINRKDILNQIIPQWS